MTQITAFPHFLELTPIYRVLEKLEVHGIIRQHTQGERNRVYIYSAYQGMLDD